MGGGTVNCIPFMLYFYCLMQAFLFAHHKIPGWGRNLPVPAFLHPGLNERRKKKRTMRAVHALFPKIGS